MEPNFKLYLSGIFTGEMYIYSNSSRALSCSLSVLSEDIQHKYGISDCLVCYISENTYSVDNSHHVCMHTSNRKRTSEGQPSTSPILHHQKFSNRFYSEACTYK